MLDLPISDFPSCIKQVREPADTQTLFTQSAVPKSCWPSLLGEVKRIPIKRRNRIFTAYRESGFSASGF
jgi:hypothetical protein